MLENRRDKRVNHLSTCWLQHRDTSYYCRLENISKSGALVSLKKPAVEPVGSGDECTVTLCLEGENVNNMIFNARIVRYGSGMAAVEFVEAESKSQKELEIIIDREQHFMDGAGKLLNLVQECAETMGIELSDIHFDAGKLNPEREIHILRISSGEYSAKVHFIRTDIESAFAGEFNQALRSKINSAVCKLKTSQM